MVTEVKFWKTITDDMRRKIICSPELLDATQEAIELHGLSGIVTVKASKYVPKNTAYVIDENRADAGSMGNHD